jgi:hypothetical protein
MASADVCGSSFASVVRIFAQIRFGRLRCITGLLVGPLTVDNGLEIIVQFFLQRPDRCGAVPLVVVGHRATAAGLERQPGLSAVECLDLRFFVNRQHHRVRRRINVEPDDVR